jgi:beta-ketoacyl ACP synthase
VHPGRDGRLAWAAHQANGRIVEIMAGVLGLPDDWVIANDIEVSGNTSAAQVVRPPAATATS